MNIDAVKTEGMDAAEQLAAAVNRPDVKLLQNEFTRCYLHARFPERAALNDAIRFAEWPERSRDGKKHAEHYGEPVRPWDNAADGRSLLAGDIVDVFVDLDVMALWQARFRAEPSAITTARAREASELRKVVTHLKNGPMRTELTRVVERAAQARHTYGCCVLGIGWKRTQRLRRATVSLEELAALAGQGLQQGNTLAADAISMIVDPMTEEPAVNVLRSWFPYVSAATARRAVRELRERGTTEFPRPEELENEPEVRFLLPFRDIVWPVETSGGLANAPFVVEIRYLTVAQVQAMAAEAEAAGEPWEKGFLEAVIDKKGHRSTAAGSVGWQPAEDPDGQLVELLWFYRPAVDADGVRVLQVTILSAHVPDRWGWHGLVDDDSGSLPFVEIVRAYETDRTLDTRGVPDCWDSTQAIVKRMGDDVLNHQQINLCPPTVGEDSFYKKRPEMRPAGHVVGMASDFEWLKPPPADYSGTERVMRMMVDEAEIRSGLNNPNGHPQRATLRQQRLTNTWLLAWSEVFHQLACLCYQHWDAERLEEILGHAPALTAGAIARHRVQLTFDVRALDSDWVLNALKAVAQWVVPLDHGGMVDYGRMVGLFMGWFDAALADELTMDKEGASQAMFEKVRNDLLQMAAGNEAMYTENDPAAEQKLGFVEQVLKTNPKYQEALNQNGPAFDARFALLFEKYVANLRQSLLQQQNKTIGRLGVKPEGMGG